MDQDRQLSIIKQCQSGDFSSFGELYDYYIKRIYNFIFYKTHHKETAEDLTSKTFTKVLEKIQQFRLQDGTFNAWIYRIAQNTVIDHYRQHRQHEDISDAWGIGDQSNIAADLDTRKSLEDVKKYLAVLSPEQRDIVMMRVWQELPYSEIAEIVGKSEENCKVIFSRTMKKLRENMPLAMFISFILINKNL